MHAPSRRFIAGAALAAVLSTATSAAPASASTACAVPDAARAYVIGLVWADGGIAKDVARFKTPSSRRADQIERAARCAGERVDKVRKDGEYRFSFPGLSGADINQAGMPPSLRRDATAGFVETKSFLAGVVESEGNRTSGLVVDDVHAGHLNAVKPLLDRVGIRWTQKGNKIYAARADWTRFETFPFNVYGRVPGYRITWS